MKRKRPYIIALLCSFLLLCLIVFDFANGKDGSPENAKVNYKYLKTDGHHTSYYINLTGKDLIESLQVPKATYDTIQAKSYITVRIRSGYLSRISYGYVLD